MKPIVIAVCQKCEKRKRKGYGEVEADLLDEGLAIFRSELLGYFRGDLSSRPLLFRARIAWHCATELGHFWTRCHRHIREARRIVVNRPRGRVVLVDR